MLFTSLDRADGIDTERELRGTVALFAQQAQRDMRGDALDVKAVSSRMREFARETGNRLTVIAEDGRVLADSDAEPGRELHETDPEVAAARARGIGIARRASASAGGEATHVVVPLELNGRRAGYIRAVRRNNTNVEALPVLLLQWVAVAGLLILLVGVGMSRRVERIVRNLVATREVAVAALRISEERLRLAARATNDVLWDWDITANEMSWNTSFRLVFGHDREDSSRDIWRSLLHPDDVARVERGVVAFLTSPAEFWTDEYRFRRADGSYAWVLDRGYALRDTDGRARRVIGSMMDITQRKEAERMKSDFVSFVSHQLRTPLAGMNWMLELAADTEGVPDEARANIADARESAARLVTLVNDLLDIARLESGRIATEPETLALRSLTQSVVAEMQTLVDERRHALEVQCDASLPDVLADAQLLRQVVGNLLSNAIKYTPAGGRIVVTISRHDGSVTWAVKDTGVGIPRAAQGRLFEKFYRAENAVSLDSEGTGLGLHLVRLIVEQAGGRVWCESEEGRGATFAFTLPAMSSVEGVRL
jgi:PAS domain S-box-containing protein